LRPKLRNATFFEKFLMFLCFGAGAVGYFFINKIFVATGRMLSWEMVIAILLWLILLFTIIQCSVNEDMKEELGDILKEQIIQAKLLQDLNKEQNEEIRLLRKDILALQESREDFLKENSARKRK
jgi:high-affinity K+ transport system ATPase subunit B